MSNFTETEMQTLWKEYSKSRDSKLRDKLIIEYSHIVKIVAGRLSIFFAGKVEYEDLISYGIFGLIDAIDKFDVKKNVKFETYASLRIRGAIIDSIRELDWVPRSVRKKNKDIEKAYAELEVTIGRPPEDKEVADFMGISESELQKQMESISASSMVSLEQFLEENYESNFESSNSSTDTKPEEMLELQDRKNILASYIDNLPEKEKKVISLYYFNYLTIKEIGNIMGITESRVSQLHTKALFRLRGKMENLKEILL